MAKSRKVAPEEPLSPTRSFQEVLLEYTAASPILVCGIILSRTVMKGKNERGEWTMHRVEVRGLEGRVTTIIINDPGTIPARGDFAIIPCFLGRNGDLRECKKFGEEF